MPTPHASQRKIVREARRFNAVACGRRFGKSTLGIDRLIEPALHRYPVGWFSPNYKMVEEVWRSVRGLLAPVTRLKSEQAHRIELITGGVVEMWSLEEPDSARGRKYRRVVIDEAASVRELESAWNAVLRLTLVDYRGDAWFLSTPKGRDFFFAAFSRGQDPLQADWASWQMPSSANPFLPPEEIETARQDLPERIYRQEMLAEFLEDEGTVFRNVRAAIDIGRAEASSPVPGRRYTLGVDLGRVEDFTVLTVVDQSGSQVYFERFREISWERQFAAVRRVHTQYGARVVVDATGMGGDMGSERLRKQGIAHTPFRFTNRSKQALIDNLAMRIEGGGARLMDIPVQTNELLAYQYEITPSRNVRMNAPDGGHDDCVVALALAFAGRQNTVEVVGRGRVF